MPLLFWLDVFVYALASIVAFSLLLIVLGAGIGKPVNLFFGLFTISSGCWTFFAAILRLSLWLDLGAPLLFGEISALAFLFMSLFLIYFTIHYLGMRKILTDIVCGLACAVYVLLAVPLFAHELILGYFFGPSGTLHMKISIYGTLTLTAPLLLAGWSLILFWLARKRVPEKYLSASVAILFAGIVLGAVLDIEIPILSFVTLSSVGMLGFGILKRQLFNPLRERNIELAREIEERMRMTEEIRRSETHVKALLEGIPDAIFYLDKDARFLDFKAPSDFTPIVPPEVFMGKTPDAFFPQELATQIATYTKKAIETGEVQHLEYSLPSGDTDRYFEARIVRRSEQNVLCIVRDVTRKKELEGWLLQTQKMEAIHRLAGGIAHDFNNLLTVMLSFADLSIIQFPSASVPGYLEQIKGSVLQATELTQQLLSFSRKQLLVPKVTNLNEIVLSMQTLLAHLIGDSIVMRAELDQGLAFVRVDPGQMRQVIMNLALNAKDALPDGGTITIRTENRFSGECPPSWPRMSAGHYVSLFVRDTGIGMDKETINHIFEPFFTTKKGKSGTGLGLAMVHGIVTQSNGFITVKSEVGVGTEFGICLPAVTSDNDVQA